MKGYPVSNAVLARLVADREQANVTINRILDGASDEDRQLSESERQLLQRVRGELESLEPQIVELVELEETRGKAADARAHLERTSPARPITPDGGPPADELGEYQTFAHYARDAILTRFAQVGGSVDPQVRQRAAQRLARVVETVTTPDLPGVIRPQYLADIVGIINKARPIVQHSKQVGLSSGKIQYPVIGTRPTVAKQPAEKTEAGVGTMTVTMAEAIAETFITSANFSWQAIQWSNPDALALWFDLAAADYAKQTELVAGTAISSISTATPIASASLEDFMAAITNAAAAVYAATGRYCDTIYSDPASAYALVGTVSATNPTFVATGGANLATGTWPGIAGLTMVVSNGLPAQTIVVGDSSALITAETPSAPVDLRAVEPSIGGMEVGIIGAFLAKVTEPMAFAELTAPAPAVQAASTRRTKSE
jgi:hypothetical protein